LPQDLNLYNYGVMKSKINILAVGDIFCR